MRPEWKCNHIRTIDPAPTDTSDDDNIGEFIRLLTEHQEALRRFVYSLMPNHPDVRDIVQEVSLVLWNKRGDFRPGSNFGAWACRVARNKVMNHRKKLSRAGWLVFDDQLVDLMATEEEELEPERLALKREALRKCLRRVPPENRNLLHARYSSPEALQRFAEQVGRTRESLRVTMCRLRGALRQCIERELGTEGGRS